MKKFLTTAIMAASALGAMAVAPAQPQVFFKGDKVPVFKSGELKECVFFNTERKTKTRAEQSEGVTVTFKLGYENEADFYPFPVFLINESTLDDETGMFMNGEAVVEGLAPGKYTIVYTFSNKSIPNYPSWMYIFKEGVEITSDSEFVADPMEANKVIAFNGLLPDGKEPVMPVNPSDDNLYDGLYDWTNATCRDVTATTMAYHEDLGLVSMGMTNILYTTPSGLTSYKSLEFAVNEVSDKWSFSQLREMETVDYKLYYMSSAVTGVNTVPPVNDLEYSEVDARFAMNPITDEFGRGDFLYMYMSTPTFDNKSAGMGFWTSSKNAVYKYYLTAPRSIATSKYPVDYYIQIQQVDFDYETESGGWMMQAQGGTKSEPISYDIASQSAVFTMAGSGFFGSPLWWNAEDSRNPLVFPGNTAFATVATHLNMPLGYSAPVNQTTMVSYADEPYPYLNLSTNYIGIYGEDRPDRQMATAFIIPEDEEEVECEMTKINSSLNELCEAGKLSRPFIIEMANDRNILVDGIQGKNITQQYYVDVINKPYGPTATMLQFRDNAGEINNSFEKASDGQILLSGGDFEYTGVNEGWTLQPVTMKVEYAPANGSDFKEIEMVEEPENLYMPAFGYFWKGDLGKVEGLTEKGWYQLRISMEDQDGNKQSQVIYPAFQILANSGVEGIAADNVESPVEYYNLQGVRINNPADGSVVIRRQGGKTTKTIVR